MLADHIDCKPELDAIANFGGWNGDDSLRMTPCRGEQR